MNRLKVAGAVKSESVWGILGPEEKMTAGPMASWLVQGDNGCGERVVFELGRAKLYDIPFSILKAEGVRTVGNGKFLPNMEVADVVVTDRRIVFVEEGGIIRYQIVYDKDRYAGGFESWLKKVGLIEVPLFSRIEGNGIGANIVLTQFRMGDAVGGESTKPKSEERILTLMPSNQRLGEVFKAFVEVLKEGSNKIMEWPANHNLAMLRTGN
jgi:hypothetical protein